MTSGMRTVIYPAPDLAASTAWYARVLDTAPYFDQPDPPGGPLGESPAPGHWEKLDEPARCAALEILARLIARMLVTAANEASHE